MRNTIYLAIAFLSLFGIAEWIYVKYKPDAEYTRKFVHAGTGFLSLLFPLLLTSAWSVLFLCGSFLLILIASLKFNLFKSVNAIERKSYGSIAYPIAVFGTFLFFLSGNDGLYHNLINFYLPILTLAICDPVAAIVGKRLPLKKFKIGDGYKSVGGAIAFFISASIISFTLLYFLYKSISSAQFIGAVFLFGIFGTIAEAFTPKGLDNITIPASQIAGLLIIRYLS